MSGKTKEKSKSQVTAVDQSKIDETLLWLEKNSESIPDGPRIIIESCLHIAQKITSLLEKNKLLRKTLGALFGAEPKSEKGSRERTEKAGSDENKPSSPDRKDLNNEGKYQGNKGKSKKKDPSKRKKKGDRRKKDHSNDSLSPEASYVPISNSNIVESAESKNLNKDEFFPDMDKTYLRSEYNQRTIINIKFLVEKVTLNVETVTNTLTGERVSAPVDEAPPYSNYTYDTILFLIHQHVEYLIPLHRLERMYALLLGVSRSTMFRFCNYVAQVFLPIYIFLFTELIQKSSVIQMDDTKTKILNETKEEEFEEADDEDEDDLKDPDKNTKKLIDPNLSIHKTLNAKIGLLSYTDKTKTLKKTNVTFITGKTVENNPESRISIFFTHAGQAGDLLDKILIKRKKDAGVLNIVCDMASFNKASLKNVLQYKVRTNACSAHARRGFWKARKLSDDMFYALRCFQLLYDIEKVIKGEEKEKILHYRKTYSKKVWDYLFKRCNQILPKWPKDSAVRNAASYVLNHFAELTAYLDNASVPIDNNLSERSIRPEKLMLAGSKFRFNSEGRAIFDILRTMLANCRHARVSWYLYAADVLRNRKKVGLNPQDWTPFAWKSRQAISIKK